MPSLKDSKLLEPLELEGLAVERDLAIKDKNYHKRPDEKRWIENLDKQDQILSAIEVKFFQELRLHSAKS